MDTPNSSTAQGRRASSNLCENKPGDTGDCTAQRTRSVPGTVVAANGYCRNKESNSNNNTTKTTKSKSNATARGFYNISENLGFKLDRERSSGFSLDNDIITSNGGYDGTFIKNDSQQDLNKCNPACYDDYLDINNTFDEDESDAEDGGNFVIKSHIKSVNPNPSPNNIDNLSSSVRSSITSTDPFYPSSLKTRSSSSSLQNPHHQPKTASIPSFNLTLNLPEREETITQGFGVKMVATSSCQQLMYRSVPPRPLSYTLTDVLEPRGSSHRSKTAPVSVNSPDDYIQRFKSRPTTRPRVIEFDGSTVSSKTKKMATVSSGFPTSRAKIYIGHTKAMSPTPQSHTARSSGSKLHLAPLEHTGRRSTSGFTPGSSRTMRTVDKSQGKGGGSLHGTQTVVTRATTKSAGSSVPDNGTKSTISYKPSTIAQDTIQSAEFSMSVPRAPTPDSEDHIHNPELLLTSNSDCDDLSILPRPKKVLPKRELPWVFRYKVKKGMNTLSRIMASKPAPSALQTNYTLT